mmetsp:Transcript_31394/g.77797  ORF Transcript_31394/g.77797 Transcript_31394/m.77797 type:complete len:220 (+) Transcript_31394:1104-1763(+)
MRRHRQIERPDFVSDVSIGGHPVGTEDDGIDLALVHEEAARTIHDQVVGDPALTQLPACQLGPLQPRPGLVHIHMEVLAGLAEAEDHTEGGAVACRRQSARVAVVDQIQPLSRPVGGGRALCLGRLGRPHGCDILVDGGDAVRAEPLVVLDVLVEDALRLIHNALADQCRTCILTNVEDGVDDLDDTGGGVHQIDRRGASLVHRLLGVLQFVFECTAAD